MPSTASPLPAQLIDLQGADALSFAQSQFTSHLLKLADDQWQLSAWLDPQGRVRGLLQLARLANDHLVILLRGGDAASLVQALRPFVFRSKVTISARPPTAISTGKALPAHTIQTDACGDVLRWGFGDYSMQTGSELSADVDWLARQVEDGLPWLPAAALGQHVGAALSLHRNGALAIDKGCYPGQEIVARLHYRGGLKRHLALLQAEVDAAPAAVLQTGDTPTGQLLNPLPIVAGSRVLAVLDDAAIPDGYRLIQRWAA